MAGLYGLLDIQKGDQKKMQMQHLRNYQLFDAPVGLFFTLNKTLETGSKMDISMMIQNVMIAGQSARFRYLPTGRMESFLSDYLRHLKYTG